tara:strand:- start:1313 stop:2452 length:1140 start_codon:yes stop_codon:yes gene_type:complete
MISMVEKPWMNARYTRHRSLPDFGEMGQKSLVESTVICIGAGGLGSPALLYLAAAGIGRIRIVDNDVVDETNLQRQVIHSNAEIGEPKVDSAARRIQMLNPLVECEAHQTRMTTENALDLLKDVDVLIDGTDNLPTRYLIDDACAIMDIPWVHASLFRYEGQVTVFNHENGPRYRDLHPDPPPSGTVLNCEEAGVIGALPGILGSIQAMEAIKILSGIGEPLSGCLMLIDTKTMETRHLTYEASTTRQEVTELNRHNDYAESGCATDGGIPMNSMTVTELHDLMQQEEPPFVLDVRRAEEEDICSIPDTDLRVRHTDILMHIDEIPSDRVVVIYCRSGIRSMTAIHALAASGRDPELLHNLTGGILAWSAEIDPTMPRY